MGRRCYDDKGMVALCLGQIPDQLCLLQDRSNGTVAGYAGRPWDPQAPEHHDQEFAFLRVMDPPRPQDLISIRRLLFGDKNLGGKSPLIDLGGCKTQFNRFSLHTDNKIGFLEGLLDNQIFPQTRQDRDTEIG